MKRRAFLRMLGLAPVLAVTPSLALPKPDSPKRLASGGAVGMPQSRIVGEVPNGFPLTFENGRLTMQTSVTRPRDGKVTIVDRGDTAGFRISV